MLQKLRAKKGQKGFTLIELMIVVAIIGILAAIAIPNFLTYQKKSKSSEAKTCIGGIKTSQLSFAAEKDHHAVCAPLVANPPNTNKQIWPAQGACGGFDSIGWRPAGDVYYLYECSTGADANGNPAVCISAKSDLDGDSIFGAFGFATDVATIATTTTVATPVTKNSQVEDLAPGQY